MVHLDELTGLTVVANVQIDEIAVAYGQRGLPKLVEILCLPELGDESSIRCLKLILSLISSQASCTAGSVTLSMLGWRLRTLFAAELRTLEVGLRIVTALIAGRQGTSCLCRCCAMRGTPAVSNKSFFAAAVLPSPGRIGTTVPGSGSSLAD